MMSRIVGLAAVFLAGGLGSAAAQPKVVASILPLQSLAAGIMTGVGEPAAIVKTAGSPHDYALRPSEARLINEAEIIFWIGPDYERFLVKPAAALAGKARAVALLKAPGVKTLATRGGGVWEGDDHGHAHGKPGVKEEEIDAHVFLSPANAKAMARAMAATLSEADSARRAQYDANAAKVIARLDAFDAELAALLAPVKGVPYVVFHDGYQYFEQHYGLNAVGSITVSPERAPGARRIGAIRRKIERLQAACVFAEPQFDAAVVRTVLEGTKARTGTLDYIGVGLAPGPDAYFAMMRGLARALAGCLSG
jgi:zinc transport system substrate-binding protein